MTGNTPLCETICRVFLTAGASILIWTFAKIDGMNLNNRHKYAQRQVSSLTTGKAKRGTLEMTPERLPSPLRLRSGHGWPGSIWRVGLDHRPGG